MPKTTQSFIGYDESDANQQFESDRRLNISKSKATEDTMIAEYRKMARTSTIICVSGFAFILFIMPPQGNVWRSGNFFQIAIVATAMAAFWFAFWSYAKAKGYSGAVDLSLPLLSVLGIIILLSLRDKTLQPNKPNISPTKPNSGMTYKCVDCNKTIYESELKNDTLFCPSCGGRVE
jgi:hypothetical protein